VRDPADTAAPVVALDPALTGARLTAATNVMGTVSDSNLDTWTLDVAPLGSDTFTVLATGTAAVAGAALATLDPSALRNGVYQLRLTATNITGRMSQTAATLEVDTAAKPVQYLRTETDLTVRLGTATINLTRTYDSLSRDESLSFGDGWSLAGQDTALQTSVPPTGNEDADIYNPFRQGTRVYLTLPDGRRVGFTFTPQRHDAPGVTYYTPAYVADAGVDWQLDSAAAVLTRGGNGLYEAQTARPYNPASGQFDGPQYTLTAPDGTVYYLSAARGVEEEILPGGQRLYSSSSGITSSTGEAIRFIRNAAGRISTIEAPDGTRVVYAYDALGNLVSAHNTVSGQRSHYGYAADDPHLLTLATAAAAGSGAAITYGTTAHVVPLTADLGGTSRFLAGSYGGNLAAGATDSFAFLLTASEIHSTRTGTVLLGVRVQAGAGSSVQPAVPTISGLIPLVQRTGPGSAFALFAVSREGLELLRITGASGDTTGAYTLQLFVAGDANQDGNVNGLDGALVASLIGTSAGQPGYVADVDANRDGVIDAADVQLVAANLGFLETRPPLLQPGTVLTHAGLAVQFDLAPQATDPQGEPIFFRLVGADDGTATVNPDGHTVTFVPGAGFAGTADFRFVADDGLAISASATVTVTVSAAPLVDLDFQKRQPRLAVGGGTQVVVVGDFADQQDVVLDPSYVTIQSTDTAVATASATGRLVGVAQGTSILLASAHGLEAATAVTVGVPQDALGQQLYSNGLYLYPLSVSLSSGGSTRQLDVHPSGDFDLATDLAPAARGTRYFVSNSGVVTVSPNGLVTAQAAGTATVTIIIGAAEAVVPVLVQNPQPGPVVVGPAGAVVQGSDGSLVAVPPGDLPAGTTVRITPKTLADLPQGFHYLGAFQLDVGAASLNLPVQLAIPVAPGTPVGSTVYFFRAGETFDNLGNLDKPIWWQAETGVVGPDGMAHTASPPYPGAADSGVYMVANGGAVILSQLHLKVALDESGKFASLDQSQIDVARETVRTLATYNASIADAFGVNMGAMVSAVTAFATLALPADPAPRPLLIQQINEFGLPITTVANVQIFPDKLNTYTTIIDPTLFPSAPDAPHITAVRLDFSQGTPVQPIVILTGAGFSSTAADMTVTFRTPNGQQVTEPATSVGPPTVPAGPGALEIRVPVPANLAVGTCQITVTRMDTALVPNPNPTGTGFTPQPRPSGSNVVQLDPYGHYVFVAQPEMQYVYGPGGQLSGVAGALGVIDGDSSPTNPNFNDLVAEIPLATPQNFPFPRAVAVTPDNTRAYATLGASGRVAVVDALALQEIDVHANASPAPAVPQPIAAPNGAALDPTLRLAQLTGPTDIRGTIALDNADWKLEIAAWTVDFQPIGAPIAEGHGKVDSGVLLKSFDPKAAGLSNGYYKLRLTATVGSTTAIDEIYFGLDASPRTKEIDLPLGALPYGIAIDPAGHYAYVADSRPYLVDQHSTDGKTYVPSDQISQIYMIDINPASPTYNQVVNTIRLEFAQNAVQVADPNKLIAPTGLRNVTVSADGLRLYVTAPNENPDPNGQGFDLPSGNLIEVVLKADPNGGPPQVDQTLAFTASMATYGVALAPQQPGSAGTGDLIAFTNAQVDNYGVQILNGAQDQKRTVSLNLDPLKVHDASGIVVTPDGKYAFIAGRADIVPKSFGGGFDGAGIEAGGVSAYLDQTANPLFEDGDVGIIQDPFGPNPKLVAATRPIPYGFPTDLALSADGKYLYVSYQGLPLIDADGHAQSGGIFVFNARAMTDLIEQLQSSGQTGSLGTAAIDDLPLTATNERNPEGPAAQAIDLKADFRADYSNLNTITFGIFAPSRAPIPVGGSPGGIAVQHGVAPTPVVLGPDPGAGSEAVLGPGGVSLTPTDTVRIETRVDPVNADVCALGSDFYFSLNTSARVTLLIDGIPVADLPDPRNEIATLSMFKDIAFGPGIYHTVLPALGLAPGEHTFQLTAVNDAGSGTDSGTIFSEVQENESLPVAHTIKGVDIWDGHLTISSQDVAIPGRGLSLSFARTYSSAGTSSAGPLGAGWTDNYNVRLVGDDCGHWTVIGGDGSGNTFSDTPLSNSAELAAEFGLPAGALFYEPQVGFHSFLVRQAAPSASGGVVYDFYTKDHTRYHFELDPNLQPFGKTYTLRFIQDTNGNRIDLYYDKADPRVAALPAALQSQFDADPTSLNVITDSSGRALILHYSDHEIFGQRRIVELTGYNSDPLDKGDLIGLDVVYNYDEGAASPEGNLTSVILRGRSADGTITESTQHYQYTAGTDVDGHNLTVYTDPNGNKTVYHYGTGASIEGHKLVSYTDPTFNPFFLIPRFEMVSSVTEPGGATIGVAESVTHFTYNLSVTPGLANTRVVTNPRPGIPPTTYTLNDYGATVKIAAPDGDGHPEANVIIMEWSTPETPRPEAFPNAAPGSNAATGIDVEMVSSTDAAGRKTSYEYDSLGNVVEQTISFAGITDPNIKPVTGADGATPVAGSKIVTRYTYDPLFSKMTSETDPDGHTVFFFFDSPVPFSAGTHASDIGVLALPTGVSAPTATGRTGNLVATVDALGDTTTYQYAAPLSDATATYTYADTSAYNGTYGPGDLMTETDADGHVTQYQGYDRYGNPTSVFAQAQGSDGAVVTQKFDARSRLVLRSTFGQTGGTLTAHSQNVYGFDGLDRLIQQTTFDDLNPLNNHFHVQASQLLPKGDPSTGAWAEEMLYQYYPAGQLRQTINGLGTVTTYLYDSGDRVQRVTEVFSADGTPTGPKTTQTSTFGYDEDNNVVDQTDFRGVHEHFKYDDLNRLIETDLVSGPAPTPTPLPLMTAHYDAVGNEQYQTDLHGDTTTFDYDGLYRLVATHLPVNSAPGVQAVVRTAYDPVGNTVLQTDANGNPSQFAFDDVNRRTKVTDALGNTVLFAYDPDGNVVDEKHIAAGQTVPLYEVITDDGAKVKDGMGRPGNVEQEVYLGDPTDPATQKVTYTTTYAYNDAANSVIVTDPRGNDPLDM
jgi:YD repeat-containing protein